MNHSVEQRIKACLHHDDDQSCIIYSHKKKNSFPTGAGIAEVWYNPRIVYIKKQFGILEIGLKSQRKERGKQKMVLASESFISISSVHLQEPFILKRKNRTFKDSSRNIFRKTKVMVALIMKY